MNIKLVIFDMDGLLINSEILYPIAQKHILNTIYHVDPPKEFYPLIMGAAADGQEATFKKYFGDNFPFYEYRKKLSEYLDVYFETIEIEKLKGCDKLMDYLDFKNIPMAIATSSNENRTNQELRQAHIDSNRFKKIIHASEVKHGKPYPDIYLYTMEQFNVSPEETIIFEDSNNGILSAIASKAKAVLVPNIAFVPEESRKQAFKIIDSLEDAIDLIENL